MKKVVITGSQGIIGSILMGGLKGYELMPADLPEVDVKDYGAILKLSKNAYAIIHLAWDTKKENYASRDIDPDNSLMYKNVYKAALQNKVKRVIMASSVHADNFRGWKSNNLISPSNRPRPVCAYGRHKLAMENLGKAYSKKGLEVICVRFGCVAPLSNIPFDEIRSVGLSHPDCISAIKKCLDAKFVPNNFSVFYAVSENKQRIHDYTNPFGWKPRTDAVKFYRKRKTG